MNGSSGEPKALSQMGHSNPRGHRSAPRSAQVSYRNNSLTWQPAHAPAGMLFNRLPQIQNPLPPWPRGCAPTNLFRHPNPYSPYRSGPRPYSNVMNSRLPFGLGRGVPGQRTVANLNPHLGFGYDAPAYANQTLNHPSGLPHSAQTFHRQGAPLASNLALANPNIQPSASSLVPAENSLQQNDTPSKSSLTHQHYSTPEPAPSVVIKIEDSPEVTRSSRTRSVTSTRPAPVVGGETGNILVSERPDRILPNKTNRTKAGLARKHQVEQESFKQAMHYENLEVEQWPISHQECWEDLLHRQRKEPLGLLRKNEDSAEGSSKIVESPPHIDLDVPVMKENVMVDETKKKQKLKRRNVEKEMTKKPTIEKQKKTEKCKMLEETTIIETNGSDACVMKRGDEARATGTTDRAYTRGSLAEPEVVLLQTPENQHGSRQQSRIMQQEYTRQGSWVSRDLGILNVKKDPWTKEQEAAVEKLAHTQRRKVEPVEPALLATTHAEREGREARQQAERSESQALIAHPNVNSLLLPLDESLLELGKRHLQQRKSRMEENRLLGYIVKDWPLPQKESCEAMIQAQRTERAKFKVRECEKQSDAAKQDLGDRESVLRSVIQINEPTTEHEASLNIMDEHNSNYEASEYNLGSDNESELEAEDQDVLSSDEDECSSEDESDAGIECGVENGQDDCDLSDSNVNRDTWAIEQSGEGHFANAKSRIAADITVGKGPTNPEQDKSVKTPAEPAGRRNPFNEAVMSHPRYRALMREHSKEQRIWRKTHGMTALDRSRHDQMAWVGLCSRQSKESKDLKAEIEKENESTKAEKPVLKLASENVRRLWQQGKMDGIHHDGDDLSICRMDLVKWALKTGLDKWSQMKGILKSEELKLGIEETPLNTVFPSYPW